MESKGNGAGRGVSMDTTVDKKGSVFFVGAVLLALSLGLIWACAESRHLESKAPSLPARATNAAASTKKSEDPPAGSTTATTTSRSTSPTTSPSQSMQGVNLPRPLSSPGAVTGGYDPRPGIYSPAGADTQDAFRDQMPGDESS